MGGKNCYIRVTSDFLQRLDSSFRAPFLFPGAPNFRRRRRGERAGVLRVDAGELVRRARDPSLTGADEILKWRSYWIIRFRKFQEYLAKFGNNSPNLNCFASIFWKLSRNSVRISSRMSTAKYHLLKTCFFEICYSKYISNHFWNSNMFVRFFC